MPEDTTSPTVRPTLWKAPLAVSLTGLLFLSLEFVWFWEGTDNGLSMIMIFAASLFAVGWVLPPRPVLHGLRMGLLTSALVVAAVPLVLAMLLGLAMSSG